MMSICLISLLAALCPTFQDSDKIDPSVQRKMKRGRPVTVILLGKTQLLSTPNGLEGFKSKNAHRKRSSLRPEVLGKLKEIASTEQQKILKALGSPEGVQPLWIVNALHLKLTPDQIVLAASLEEVKYVYPGRNIRTGKASGTVLEVLKPEERSDFKWEGKKIPWNLKEIGAVSAWKEHGAFGQGVVVAMLDSGVNYLHEDLKKNVWINTEEKPNNGIDDDGNGYVDDYYGYHFSRKTCRVIAQGKKQHGTWTSGIVAGDGTGGTVTGVAPLAKIMILKGGGTIGAALAHQYALENGADVMSMSFSIPGLGNLRGFWRLMSEQSVAAGLVLVSGAGNFQQQAKLPVQQRIPEGIPCVISAGGVNRDRKLVRFSSLGPVEWEKVKFYEDFPLPKGLVKPDVCAFPGAGYPVLGVEGNSGYIDPNRRIRGNSFSGPHVAGTVALIFSANPDLTAWRVKEILEETARDVKPEGKDNRTGTGLIHAGQAVEAAKKKEPKK